MRHGNAKFGRAGNGFLLDEEAHIGGPAAAELFRNLWIRECHKDTDVEGGAVKRREGCKAKTDLAEAMYTGLSDSPECHLKTFLDMCAEKQTHYIDWQYDSGGFQPTLGFTVTVVIDHNENDD